jgi:MFS family permease
VLVAGFFMGVFGYLYMPTINVILYDVVPPETRSSATAADGVMVSAFSALTAFAIGAMSHYLGMRQGLDEGDLGAGFQVAVTVLLVSAVILTLFLLRAAPADMAALRAYVGRRAVAAEVVSEDG